MSKPPFISIIIPTYNRVDLILKTLQSVFAQTYDDYEVIVVDDGSEDDTPELLRGQKIRYVRHEANKGAAAARNTGADIARGHYLAFLDSDDVWLFNKLEKQISDIQHTRALVVGTQSLKLDEENKTCLSQFHPERLGTNSEQLLQNLQVNTSSLLIEKNLFMKVNGFDTQLKVYEDWDLLIRLAEHTDYFFITQEVLVISHTHSLNTSKLTGSEKKLENAIIFLNKHTRIFNNFKKSKQLFLYNLGHIARRARKPKEARSHFWKSFIAKPNSIRAIKSLVLLLLTLSPVQQKNRVL